MPTRIANEIENGKKSRVYIMIDQRAPDFALVKNGISADTLKNRFNQYRSSNPMLTLVATAEVRSNQNLETVEKMLFEYCRTEKGYNHFYGEWMVIDNAEDIEALKREGFRFYGKMFYRLKNQTFYRKMVCELWQGRKR